MVQNFVLQPLVLPLWQWGILAIVLIFGGLLVGRLLRYQIIREARGNAIVRSKSVILWEVYEKLAPLVRGFPYRARDMIFVGKWVDYVIFDGLSEGELREIIFLELKTGGGVQNKNEKSIERIIQQRKVRYEVIRLGESIKEGAPPGWIKK
jgi:predicted Holliday junction resolvase-like endonuclease